MDGYQVCQKLKQNESTHDIPVIFMSVLEDTGDKVRAFNMGGADYITKPFEFREVLARIETHLALRRVRQQLLAANEELESRFRELQAYRDHLEDIVAERTAELTRTNNQLREEIAERVRVQERLAYQAYLLQNISDAVIATDRNGHIQGWNEAAAKIYGWQEYEVAGQPIEKVLDTKFIDSSMREVEKALLTRGQWQGETIQRCRDGQMIYVMASASLLKDRDGNPVGGVIINHDITARKQAEQELARYRDHLEELVRQRTSELEESNRHLQEEITERTRAETQRDAMLEVLQERTAQLEALREVGLQLSAQLDLDLVLRSVVSRALELLGGAAGSLNLYRAERDVLEVVTTEGDILLPPGNVFRRNEGLAGKVWESGKPLVVEDYHAWGGRVEEARPTRITAAVGVPIRWGEGSLGTLVVVDTAQRTFSQSDTDLLSLFATQAAIAIENARLYDQAQRDAEMKATLLHEVNHRVGNSLSVLIGLLEIEQSYLEGGDERRCQAALKGMANRLQGLAAVHRMLSSAGWTSLRLDELSRQIIETVLRLLPMDKYVSLEVTPSQVRVSPKQAHNLGLVINELATNAVKYAWPDRDRGSLAVDIKLEEDGETVRFEFRDDGPGYPEAALLLERHTVGFDLIQDMVSYALDGELSLYNQAGAVALIRFKAAADVL
jgi:PAS domain S-box-containing protein